MTRGLAGGHSTQGGEVIQRLGRSIGALFAGFVLVVVLSIGADAMRHKTGVFPQIGRPMSDGLFLLATLYRTAFAIAASYVTARLAPHHPMQHALVGGLIGLLLSTAGAMATWNRGPEFGPHWYPLSLVVLALPSAWAGGRIYCSRS